MNRSGDPANVDRWHCMKRLFSKEKSVSPDHQNQRDSSQANLTKSPLQSHHVGDATGSLVSSDDPRPRL